MSRPTPNPMGLSNALRLTLAVCHIGLLAIYSAFAQGKVLQVSENELRASATLRIEPEYPAVARQIRLTGDVELEVSIDTTGTVDKVTLLRGNTLLAGPSEQAIRKWKFTPFLASGQPVSVVGTIRFVFQI